MSLYIYDDPLNLIKIEKLLDERFLKKHTNSNNFKFRENFICIYNCLLFSNQQIEYMQFKNKNIANILNYEIKPELIIETLMQTNLIINYLNDNNKLQIKEIKKNLFNINNQKEILYFFEENNTSKSYRKRLLALSTENIRYIPFITRTINENTFSDKFFDKIYGERIDILLQRAPYFYLESELNKEICNKLENYLTNKNKNFLKMNSFNLVDKLFYRYNCYQFIEKFINKNFDNLIKKIKEDFNISIEIPLSIPYNLDKEKLDFLKNYLENNLNLNFDNKKNNEEIYNFQSAMRTEILKKMLENNLNFPIVIKPEQCKVHEMMLIISEKGLNKFTEIENFKKIFINKNFILQRFINHDGLMFKNFFLNKKSYTFIRPSLPNLAGKNLDIKHFKDNCFTFKNEFLYGKEDNSFWENIHNNGENMLSKEINYELIDCISKKFADDMEINLFGLDYLFDRVNNVYYLLECNYFPSYRELNDKLAEEFEKHMISYHDDYMNKEK